MMGPSGAIGLVAHSFLDGAAIGIAIKPIPKIGIIVALAGISDDFTDGTNTVVIMLKNEQNVRNARNISLRRCDSPGVWYHSGIVLCDRLNCSDA